MQPAWDICAKQLDLKVMAPWAESLKSYELARDLIQ
jgi:hypothetical protein